jgi:hypothetical protein
VTSQAARIAVGGGHRHVFFNPSGAVFEVGCFSMAPGCGTVGAPTTEFTWFAGHAWQVAVCRACRAHLGWRYAAVGAPGEAFWGLILPHLAEGPDQDAG